MTPPTRTVIRSRCLRPDITSQGSESGPATLTAETVRLAEETPARYRPEGALSPLERLQAELLDLGELLFEARSMGSGHADRNSARLSPDPTSPMRMGIPVQTTLRGRLADATPPRGPMKWGRQDSNLCRHSQLVYSQSPLTTRALPRLS